MSDDNGKPHGETMKVLLAFLGKRQQEMTHLLGEFVRCESPSADREAVNRFGQIVASQWRKRGARVRVVRQARRGSHVRAEIVARGIRPSGQILILGHLDTVHPAGTLAKFPYRLSGGRAWGPGTFDMKAGLVLALFAADALQAAGLRPHRRLVFLWTSDEEIGSAASRRLIEQEARRSECVLVLEPPLGRDGRLKTERHGVGDAELIVTGRAAHAGVDPQRGVNAVHELALQIARLLAWDNPRRGIRVQATVVSGGTASNVIPASARAEIDIRYARVGDAPKILRMLRGLRPILPGARIQVRGAISRPPMVRTAASSKLFQQAQSLMREIGLPLGEASTGGGSDGSFAAALGVPTLDGLGAVGDGAHTLREHVVIRTLAQRAALLAGLLASL